LSSFVTFHLDPWNFCFFSREVPGGSQEQRRVRARRFLARGWPAARGKWRGARELPLGGRGSSGEGLRRRVRGEGRPAVGLIAGGHAPVREGGSGWVGELQEGDGVPFQGSA